MSTQRLFCQLLKQQRITANKRAFQRSFTKTGKNNQVNPVIARFSNFFRKAFQRERALQYPRFAIQPDLHGKWITPKDLTKYEQLEKGQKAEHDLVTLAGRILSKRESSAKLVFYDIVQNGQPVQVVASRARFNGSADEFAERNRDLCRGDIVCKYCFDSIRLRK
jgi:lysyl-tRNA synthetase class II